MNGSAESTKNYGIFVQNFVGSRPRNAIPISKMRLPDGHDAANLIISSSTSVYCAASSYLRCGLPSWLLVPSSLKILSSNATWGIIPDAVLNAMHALVSSGPCERSRRSYGSPLPFGKSFRISHPYSSSGFSGSIPRHER